MLISGILMSLSGKKNLVYETKPVISSGAGPTR